VVQDLLDMARPKVCLCVQKWKKGTVAREVGQIISRDEGKWLVWVALGH